MEWRPLQSRNPGVTHPLGSLPDRNREFFAYLSEHVQESHLKLSITCDVQSLDLAVQLTEPVRRLPVLKEVAIRLNTPWSVWGGTLPGDILWHGGLRPAALRLLADDLVNHLTDESRLSRQAPVPKEPFRYLDLPPEVKLMVLEWTDLVAPGKLAWHPVDGFNCDRQQDEFHRCSTCRAVQEYRSEGRGTFLAVLVRRCKCWKFPMSLFQVSRTMHLMATKIFYSKNIFEVIPLLHFGDHWNDDRSFSLFFLPPNALRDLRKLVFHVPGSFFEGHGDPELEHAVEHEVFEVLRKGASLQQLQLMMVLCLPPNSRLFSLAQEEKDDSDPDKSSQLQLFRRFAEPLCQLRRHGLKDLFFELRVVRDTMLVPADDLESEAVLEKYVMGDTYNSMDGGKQKLRQMI